jgi:SpoVK/Ycf46/Vps4 family AAA+-type ATPase
MVKAASSGDQVLLRRTLEALIAEERAKQHHVLADRLAEYLNGNGTSKQSVVGSERVQQLLYEVIPRRAFSDLILPDIVRQMCDEVVEEHQRRDLLRSYGLEPRHRVLLVGPPGNGKTSLAEALAEALLIPLVVVRYEGVIGSYLGETASRVARLFEYVRTRQCVLFLDEFDTLGKERGDIHDTGEIKRVVSSLLLQLDSLPSHVLVVTATNHAELLDRAIWRRFQVRLELPLPGRAAREAWFARFAERMQKPLGYSPRTLADRLSGMTFSELEDFCADVLRRHVLSLPNDDLKGIVADRLKQWQARARACNPADE